MNPARALGRERVGLLPGPNPSANPVGVEEERYAALATHAQNLPASRRGRTRTLIAGVVVTAAVGMLGTLPAHAAPAAPPSTSGDAKTAWRNSSHLAEVASEQVNGAKQDQVKAQQAAVEAGADLAAAKTKVSATQLAAAAAGATVASFQAKLDGFASASYRGANTSQLSVMLTAKSAEDFLDESTVMNRVAQDTHETLDQAVAAKNTAAKATADAASAETAAVAAKSGADRAAAAAAAATVTAQSKKAALDTAVRNYQSLYNKLSAQEKAAAAAAAEKARQESIAAAAAAAAKAQADAAAAASSSSSSSSSASAALARAVDASSADDDADTTTASTSAAAPATTEAEAAAATTEAAETTSSAVATTAAPAAAASSSGDSAGEIAAAAAKSKIGFAYSYAGDGPDAYDCSGLTTWAWAQAGISIPRVSYEQANFPEVPLDQLQPGDLVTYYSPVSHVAIYVGGGMVVSAADESLGIIYVPVDRGGPDPTGHRVPRG